MTGSLRSARGKFYAVLNLKDEHGNKKQKTISLNLDDVPGNKRRAEKALRDVLNEYEKNKITVYRKDTLLCDYFKVWLEDVKPNIQLITYEAYQSYIDLHLFPYFHKLGVSLQDLNYQHIQGYYASKKGKLKANSLRKHHVVINSTLRKALKHDLIHNNPADKVTLPKVDKFEGSYLTIEQGNTLLDVSAGTVMEPAIILGMMYGLRRSEIPGLKWGAICFESNTLIIRHTVTKFKTIVARDGTKNKSSNRILKLNPDVRKYLYKLRAQQFQDKLLLGQAYHDTEYVCRWADGRALTCDYLSKAFKRLLLKNGLPDVRLHDLRHSYASYMLKTGRTMKEVADWLGHSTIKTAMDVYGHIDMETKQSIADSFTSILAIKV